MSMRKQEDDLAVPPCAKGIMNGNGGAGGKTIRKLGNLVLQCAEPGPDAAWCGGPERMTVFRPNGDDHARRDEELQRALRRAEEERAKAEAIIAALDDGISIQDRNLRVLYQNQIHKNSFGDHTAKHCYKEFAKSDHVCEECPLADSFQDGRVNTAIRSVTTDRGTAYYEITASPLRDASGNIVAGVEVVRDITARKAIEESLLAEKERLAVTLRSIGEGVITTDTEGRITLMNAVAERLTGWTQEESAGRPLGEIFSPLHERSRERGENPVDAVLQTGTISPSDDYARLVSRDGEKRIIVNSASPIRDREGCVIGVVLAFRDMTETRRMETELLKMEKLESLGVLAGGIAHDFNNILSGVIGFLSLAKMQACGDEKIVGILADAEKVALRGKGLTQQLLTFSKNGWPVKNPASIAELIKESAAFALCGSNVKHECSFPPDLWPVEVDEGQFSQVIHNLIINAHEAMPDGGLIMISAENLIITEPLDMPLSPGKYVKLSIGDRGAGIAAEHLPKIFDPYFTTKAKGNGLGLATVYSIISKHGGHITVRSEAGRGTTFVIYLPASQKPMVKGAREEDRVYTGEGRILVMDDDDTVRAAVRDMLLALGYTVELAREGEEALCLYKKALASRGPFDAVIMDMTIPGGMGGKEAIGKLLAVDPGAKAIVSSGYTDGPIISGYKDYGFADIIAKPFSITELSRVVHAVVNGGDDHKTMHG